MLHRLCFVMALLVASQVVFAQDKPVPPNEAAAKFKLPPGFKATLFAGEPDVVQPIAFTFDDRGRLWVVECHTYPEWNGDRHDRVLILEDTDGDGRRDKRTVFLDNGKNLTGIEYGFGGIWLTAVPNLIFVPDKDKDDKPDGPPVVKLDGWDLKAKHNVVNGLAWAPDGWLWGLNGILSNSSVGKPGTTEEQRVKMNCGVWRYHPVSEKFEVVAHGTTNPWGLDFDEYGEAFITNCVIKHAFHVVPGAHFERMFGQDINPRTYQLIPSIADHIHWGGGHWTESRGGVGAHDAPGGGHAHSGCMIYLGDNWPAQYRGRLYTCNIHGSRVNQDRLERNGSSYIAKHESDVLLANDPWFRGLAIKYGPDGGVYVADWSDTGECHDYDVADRSNGRIYKVTYGNIDKNIVNLNQRDTELSVLAMTAKNEWHAAHARRILMERSFAKELDLKFSVEELRSTLIKREGPAETPRGRLRGLWLLIAMGELDDATRLALMKDTDENVVAWTIRSYQASQPPSPTDGDLPESRENMKIALCSATSSASLKVRLDLASVAQRDAGLARIVATRLAQRPDSIDVPYLPEMIWYAIEKNLAHFVEYVEIDLPKFKIPLVRESLARRLTEPSETDFAANLNRLLKTVASHPDDIDLQRDIARGVFASLDGRRDLKPPSSWRAAYRVLSQHDDAAVRDIAVKLALTFGDEEAIGELLAQIDDEKIEVNRRSAAVAALAQGKVAKLSPILFTLLDDAELRTTALRHLPSFGETKTPGVLLEKYASFDGDTKREAIATLTARADWATALLDAVEANRISKADFTAYHWQQLVSLGDKAILERVEKLFGNVRPTKEDRLAQIARWKELLSGEAQVTADARHGRAVFNKTCAACHKLFEAGGNIGPELTGAQRTNLDYVLTNMLDPSAVVGRDYQMQVVEFNDGRVLVGVVKAETDAVITLQTATALLKIAKTDIEARTATPQSMMPEGLVQQLSFEEFRDLVAYLGSPKQVEP